MVGDIMVASIWSYLSNDNRLYRLTVFLQDGRLHVGDQIVSINGEAMIGVTLEKAMSTLTRLKLRSAVNSLQQEKKTSLESRPSKKKYWQKSCFIRGAKRHGTIFLIAVLPCTITCFEFHCFSLSLNPWQGMREIMKKKKRRIRTLAYASTVILTLSSAKIQVIQFLKKKKKERRRKM